jgi:uncharacterized protein YoxC
MNQIVQSPLPLDVNVQLGEALNVTVVDRRQESIAFFNHFNAFQRGQIAAEVWQVGLRALEHAQAGANAARLEDVGKALLEDVQDKLHAHVDAQTREVEAQLRGFLDPKDGRLMQRLDGLLKDNGELARMLQQHTGPGSKMQSTLLAAINPLLRTLNPTDQDGVVLVIKRQVEQVLGASQAAVKDALDPMVEKSAANRFLAGLREQLKAAGTAQEQQLMKVTAALDANNEQSLLSRLLRETRAAQTQVLAALNPSDERSLLAPLRKTIEDLLAGYQRQQMDALETQRARQAAFEKDILEKVTRLETRKDALRRGVKAGQDFEVQVCEFTSSILSGGPYDVEFTGNTAPPGSRRKVGDVVVAFNSESRFSGSRIVLEAKYEAGMTPKKALAELADARENRGAQVGVFVLSSVAAASSTAFPAFMRCGCDILVHWSPEEPASDAYLHAALLLALALAARLQTHEVVDELRELEALEKVLTGHLQRAEGLQKKAKVLVATANDMAGELNAGIVEVREMADAVNRLLRSARAEHAVEVETSSEQVVAVNQLGAEGLALLPG